MWPIHDPVNLSLNLSQINTPVVVLQATLRVDGSNETFVISQGFESSWPLSLVGSWDNFSKPISMELSDGTYCKLFGPDVGVPHVKATSLFCAPAAATVLLADGTYEFKFIAGVVWCTDTAKNTFVDATGVNRNHRCDTVCAL